MINVVFLLLIFFLMTAQIAPPDPFDITLPAAAGDEPPQEADTLYLSRDGEAAFGALRGVEAVAAAAQGGTVTVRADAQAEGAALARTLQSLAAAGATDVTLLTEGGARADR